MHFESLNIIEPILRSLKEEGYTIPTPIQTEAIPVVLNGTDLIGCAQTGTGKTAAFAVPILQLLHGNRIFERKKRIRSLVVTPTRELAIQIEESFKSYGRYTGLSCTVVFGGVNQNPQTASLRNGVDILIATPGRLLDLMNQGFISLKDVEIFVLDEADRMLDMGFIHDVRRIISALPHKRQSLFFSATMPPEIVRLAGSIVNKPVKVEVTPSASTVDIVNQYVYFIDKGNKNAMLIDLLKDKMIKTALVFTRTKFGADKVVKVLQRKNISAEAIHGNKAQNARQRALSNFKAQKTRVLVATDIAARGIDVDDLVKQNVFLFLRPDEEGHALEDWNLEGAEDFHHRYHHDQVCTGQIALDVGHQDAFDFNISHAFLGYSFLDRIFGNGGGVNSGTTSDNNQFTHASIQPPF